MNYPNLDAALRAFEDSCESYDEDRARLIYDFVLQKDKELASDSDYSALYKVYREGGFEAVVAQGYKFSALTFSRQIANLPEHQTHKWERTPKSK